MVWHILHSALDLHYLYIYTLHFLPLMYILLDVAVLLQPNGFHGMDRWPSFVDESRVVAVQ